MSPRFDCDPIENAIQIQLGGVFSQNPLNPELLITSAIDKKYYPRPHLTKRLILLALQGYTQAEMGVLLGISQRHVGRLMSKIPFSDPLLVGGVEKVDRIQKIETELRRYQIHKRKMKHPLPDPHPDPRGWRRISEGGYVRRKLPTCDRQFEEEF
jgi:hypothetical protein